MGVEAVEIVEDVEDFESVRIVEFVRSTEHGAGSTEQAAGTAFSFILFPPTSSEAKPSDPPTSNSAKRSGLLNP
jgi:hypothetical protein